MQLEDVSVARERARTNQEGGGAMNSNARGEREREREREMRCEKPIAIIFVGPTGVISAGVSKIGRHHEPDTHSRN